ncbi:hypothetical protein [Nocardioides montaniterrae]
MRRTSIAVSLVAALVAAAGLVGISGTAARAAAGCAYDTGVVVVVDYNGLGGNQERKGCDPVDGHYAETNFNKAGFTLGELQSGGMQGYVCTINGFPTDHQCTGADSYWSLWVADGKGGSWGYSGQGVGSLKVPPGGYVAFSWHQGSGSATPPDVAPTARAAKPTPTPAPVPTPKPTHQPTGTHHAAAPPSVAASTALPTQAVPSDSASPSASRSPKASKKAHVETPVPLPSDTTLPSILPSIDTIQAGPPTSGGDGKGDATTTWLAIAAGVLVVGAAALVPILRRRKG